MIGRIYDLSALRTNYQKKLRYFNVSHPIGKHPLTGYGSAGAFASNLRAPFQISIVGIGEILQSSIHCLENLLLLGTTFMTFDFPSAKNHGIEVINSITTMLYTAAKGIFDMVFSTLELLTRSAATVIEGAAEVASPFMGR